MSSIDKRKKFLEEISASIRDNVAHIDAEQDKNDEEQTTEDLQKELERKFDELFGSIEDDEDN